MNIHPRAIKIRLSAALVLGVIGIVTSLCTIYAAPIEGVTNLSCGFEALNCGKALTSHFAKIGGIPLGVFGVFYFTLWTLNLRAYMLTGDEIHRFTISYATLLGALGSLTLASIMFGVLRAPCLYCLLTHACNLGSLALLWPVLRWRPGFITTTDHARHFLAIITIALLAAIAMHLANEKRILEARIVQMQKTIW